MPTADLITSRANPRVKRMRALRQRKERDASGACLVEGVRHVAEAAEAGAVVEAVAYAPGRLTSPFALDLIRRLAARGADCLPLAPDVFETVADKDSPQDIVAVVRQRRAALDDLSPRNLDWAVALVEPQDPGNVGAILRTLDAVGAGGLILIGDAADPYHPASIRASMGALFWLPVASATFEAFAAWAGRHAYRIVGTSARGQADYRQADYARPLILLLGSEREGLSEAHKAICRQLVRLPMRGRASSLNLAVAAGVLLYQAMPGAGGRE
jgi:TrmH family RNA methyltransferase